jgi:hypothetical protein
VHRWSALVVLTACSGASGSTSTSSSSPPVADHRGENPVDPASRHMHDVMPPIGGIEENPVPACPPETDLVPRLREIWQVPPDAAIDVVGCVRGRFGKAGWLVDAFIDVGDDESEQRIEILAADGDGVIAALDPGSTAPVDRFDSDTGNGWDAVDLDADGTDELLRLQDWNHVAVLSTTMAVYRIDGAALRGVATLPLAYDNKGAKGMTPKRVVQCESQHALADGPNGSRMIQVEGIITTSGRQAGPIAAGHCPLAGSHRYRLAGGALEEVKP